MKVLLDTCTLLWLAADAPELSPVARAAYSDPDNEVFLSVVSLWEILVKQRLGKLPLPLPLSEFIEPLVKSHSASTISLTPSAVMRLASLPDVHRDPFDRMIVCQAIDQSLTILTPDNMIRSYPVSTLW